MFKEVICGMIKIFKKSNEVSCEFIKLRKEGRIAQCYV